jgi:hypothetical protein
MRFMSVVIYVPDLGQSAPRQYIHWGFHFLMRRSRLEDSGVPMSVCDACWEDRRSRAARFARKRWLDYQALYLQVVKD